MRPDMDHVSAPATFERLNLATRTALQAVRPVDDARIAGRQENHAARGQPSTSLPTTSCRVHSTLTKEAGRKTTPAMASGLTDRVWTVEDLVASDGPESCYSQIDPAPLSPFPFPPFPYDAVPWSASAKVSSIDDDRLLHPRYSSEPTTPADPAASPRSATSLPICSRHPLAGCRLPRWCGPRFGASGWSSTIWSPRSSTSLRNR